MKFFKVIIFLAIAAGIIFYFRDVLFNFSAPLPEFKETTDFVISEIKKEVVAPEPLRARQETPEAFLTKNGVIALTNLQRQQNGLASLKDNPLLDKAAALKLKDMFTNQYFGHISTSGAGPDFWIEKSGYEYVMIGENLALGNFEDDQELIEAWMQSPGHRANILNQRYQEIGVAVGRGTFEGKLTWLAVQEFGLPLAVCPRVDNGLKITIDANKVKLDELRNTLEGLRLEIEKRRPRESDYNQKIEEYNSLVSVYNNLIEETRTLIEEYNHQVKLFNECIVGG